MGCGSSVQPQEDPKPAQPSGPTAQSPPRSQCQQSLVNLPVSHQASQQQQSDAALLDGIPDHVAPVYHRDHSHSTVAHVVPRCRETPSQAAMRRAMITASSSSTHPLGHRAPTWTSKSFIGEFGDCFVESTQLEGGRTEACIPELCQVMDETLQSYEQSMSLFTSSTDTDAVRVVQEKLQQAAVVADELHACGGWQHASFEGFLRARSDEIKALPPGDFLLWCGGWSGISSGHAVMFLVDRISDTEVAFVVMNTGDGVMYHPEYAAGYPKQMRYTQMRLVTTLDRISDPCWLYYIFKIQAGRHKDHKAEMLYLHQLRFHRHYLQEVCLPALVQDSLVRACHEQKVKEDAFAKPETLQRSGVCYYRCILTAVRYSLRRLGLKQDQVKQFLHAIRRSFVARVTEDLQCAHQLTASQDNNNQLAERGIYPSQLQLVLLSTEMLAHSAIKESKNGRASSETLAQVLEEVESARALASSLACIVLGEDTNEWMAPVTQENTALASNEFCEVLVSLRTISTDLDEFAGDPITASENQEVDFLSLPTNPVEISSPLALQQTLCTLRKLCGGIKHDSCSITHQLVQIECLIEHSFTVLLPIPIWGASCSHWHALDLAAFQLLRDTLRWLAHEYAAVCLSLPSDELNPIRALTNAAIMCAFFEVLLWCPASNADAKHGDEIVSAMLRESGIRFPTATRKGEDFWDFTSEFVMEDMVLVKSRSELCEYMFQMRQNTSEIAFEFVAEVEWKLDSNSTAIMRTMTTIEKLAVVVEGQYLDPDDRLFDNVRGSGEKMSDLNLVQRGLAWMLQPFGQGGDWAHLDSWLCLRDMVTLFVFSISAPLEATHLGRIFEHFESGGHDAPADSIGFEFDGRVEFDDDFEVGEIQKGIEDSPWQQPMPSEQRCYPRSSADPKMWIEKQGKSNTVQESYVTEDDVLHMPELCDFDSTISQEEAEQLFSYLTVPSMRIPLVLEFFAQDRVGALFNAQLRDLLWQTLFCPGPWGCRSMATDIKNVPCKRELLFSELGYFVAELELGPQTTLCALMRILEDGIHLAVGCFDSSFVPVLLYLVRLAVRALTFIRSLDADRVKEPVLLGAYDSELACWLEMAGLILEKWQCEAAEAQRKDAECTFQCHSALLVWTCVEPTGEGVQFNEKMACRLLGSVAFVRTWNVLGDCNSKEVTIDHDHAQHEDDSSNFALGVSDQAVFQLVQHRRVYLQSYFNSLLDDYPKLKTLLEVAIQLTTGETDISWNGEPTAERANQHINVADGTNHLLSFTDINSVFSVQCQTCIVTYKTCKLQPVPDAIARHPDFRSVYHENTPHCATLSELTNRHEVFIPDTKKRITLWQSPLCRLTYPGCPSPPGSSDSSKSQTLESSHPYKPGEQLQHTCTFEADQINIHFDQRSAFREFYDKLTIRWVDKDTAEIMEQECPKAPDDPFGEGTFEQLFINASSFGLTWESLDVGDTEGMFGWRLTATPAANTQASAVLEFNGVLYGGVDREYHYGDCAPIDLPWLPSVLDPVLHSELTTVNTNVPGSVDWMQVEGTVDDTSKLVYLLPATSTPSEHESVFLLSKSDEEAAGKQFWRLFRVSRYLQTVDVFVLDLLGRRTFLRQVYASDLRMALCANFPKKAHQGQMVHPPKHIVRFAMGDLLAPPTGGNDVLIQDTSKPGDGRLLLPPRTLQGVLPGALLEGFDFWEQTSTGHIAGTQKELTRKTEKGDVPFLDPFFGFLLEVQHIVDRAEGTTTVVLRSDTDPVTNAVSVRRLVDLRCCATMEPLAAEILKQLTQIDSLSHILAWTKPFADADSARYAESTELKVALIELPRLQIRFQAPTAGAAISTGLSVMDRPGFFVLPDRSTVNGDLLQGLPHCLVLSDPAGNLELLIPNYPLTRPKISTHPFSTSCMPNAVNTDWLSNSDARYYLFPVHPSNSFVTFTSIGATLYWAFLKFMHRCYSDSFKVIESSSTDMPLTRSEFIMLSVFKNGDDDKHPDAHACRLKLRLSLLHSPIEKWPVIADEGTNPTFAEEYKTYLLKRPHVSMACRLSYLEEVKIIKYLVIHCQDDSQDAIILTRANYLDRRIVGDERKMLIQHWPCVLESEHPFQPSSLNHHDKAFLLPHARAVVVEFDPRCETELYADTLTFGTDSMLWAPLLPLPKTWHKGCVELAGSDFQSIVICGNRCEATFESTINGSSLWGYRFTCRPAHDDELPESERTLNATAFEASSFRQQDGGSEWNEEVIHAIDPYHGGATIEALRACTGTWFGSISIDKSMVAPHLEGRDLMVALNTLWSADFTGTQGGGYAALMNILSGNTIVSIGGPCSSRMLVEMIVRTSVHLKKSSPPSATSLLVAAVGLPESTFEFGARAFSSCPNYNDEMLGTDPNCYASSLDTATPADKLHLTEYLRVHAEILCKAVVEGREIMQAKATRLEQNSTLMLRIDSANTERESLVGSTNCANDEYTCSAVDMGLASFSSDDLEVFLHQPLKRTIKLDTYISMHDAGRNVPSKPLYDISRHPDAEGANASATIERISKDCMDHATEENARLVNVLVDITPELLQQLEEQQGSMGGFSSDKPAFTRTALPKLRILKAQLKTAVELDVHRIAQATEHVLAIANNVPDKHVSSAQDRDQHLEFHLLRAARQQTKLSLSHLVRSVASTEARIDIQRLNPFLTDVVVHKLLHATIGIMLTAVRVVQLRRAMSRTDAVTHALQSNARAKAIQEKIDDLVETLLAQRHYLQEGFKIDPRFLLFEFVTTFMLRKSQIRLVNTFMKASSGSLMHPRSLVHQMIMGKCNARCQANDHFLCAGAGKTTVVGPLLALMLANGTSLVTWAVPNTLLDMSQRIIWAAFCNVVVKPVFTLTMDRSWTDQNIYVSIFEKMLLAQQAGGVVCTTPEAIKSLVNKYVELLHTIAHAPIEQLSKQAKKSNSHAGKRAAVRLAKLQAHSDTADCIAKIMNLWSARERGVLLLDEVDVLLHPLRSELNFPIGQKQSLKPSGMRWTLPMHLLGVVLQAATAPQGTDDSLALALRNGLMTQRLQSVPHLILLDESFYDENLRALLVRCSLSWLKAHHVFESCSHLFESCVDTAQLEEYISLGNFSSTGAVETITSLPAETIQALNLAHDWTSSYMPHVLGKINRVSFGLLQQADEHVLKGGTQPTSRKLLAIPFIGKDVPSAASEFAQPDVLIGVTVMAYYYEGLRISDMKQTLRLLKDALQMESGRKTSRPSYRLYEAWVSSACARQGLHGMQRPVMSLDLIQIGDTKQMKSLFELFRMELDVINHYLQEIVFPHTMQQQPLKISASGQELGSSILFGMRLGFSGTPSNMLPLEMLPCHFEKGSQGKVLRMLTDVSITKEAQFSREISAPWTVKGLLDQIAQSQDPQFRALIDTGALITGYSNEEVARYLIDTGLDHLKGCVFLDHANAKMIYLRGAARCIPLTECGIGCEFAFTFYDQVHTTGMDIKQSLSACALLTIGKDMIMRDLAQGAFRMRGIGKGQTIHMFVPSEIKKLIIKTLPSPSERLEVNVSAWLQLQELKAEQLQFLQLCSQDLQSVWRKPALHTLFMSSGVEGIETEGVKMDDSSDQGLGRGMLRLQQDCTLRVCVDALCEGVDLDIPSIVPSLEPYSVVLQQEVDGRKSLVHTKHQQQVVALVMEKTRETSSNRAAAGAAQILKGLDSEMTREKEREQEQQKQKQQQKQQETAFCRDEGEPFAWPVEVLGTSMPHASDVNHTDFPFYQLNMFSPRPFELSFQPAGSKELKTFPAMSPLAFPASVLQSTNFAPLQHANRTKPLRLKNVCMLLDWCPDALSAEHMTVVVTLAEAETLRQLIRATKSSSDVCTVLPDAVAMALTLSPSNVILETTRNYPGSSSGGSGFFSKEQVCLRFLNNDMYYEQQEIAALLSSTAASSARERLAFFEGSIIARRRSRQSWASTPLQSVFLFEHEHSFADILSLVEQVQKALIGCDIMDVCEQADTSGTGFLSQGELYELLNSFCGVSPAITPARLQLLVQFIDANGDNAVDYAEFDTLFGAQATTTSQLEAVRVNT